MEFKLARINLSTQKVTEERIDDKTLRKFIGGRGLGAYLALKEIPKGIDPFSPENKVYILTGPIVGTAAIESGRYHVVAKSPLTGILGDANSGGQFGPWLRFAGYDGLILEGASEEPVWISIVNGEVKFHDAKHLWGKGVIHTEKVIRETVGVTKESLGSVLSVGPAAENRSRIAAVMNDRYRAAGRSGLASVIASKGVKAIWAYGNRKVLDELYDKRKYMEEAKKLIKKILDHPISKSLYEFGTAVLVNVINAHGALPTKNWTRGTFEKAFNISGERLAEVYLKTRKGCWGCAIQCSRVSEVESGPFKTPLSEGPEYETIWANGADTMIGDLDALVKANYLLNDMGFDTISFGATVATLMEIYERAKKGELPEEKAKELFELLGDVNPEWGNSHALLQLIWMTAYRNRIGDLVAEGAKRLAEYFGVPEAAVHVRGMEMPAYDPRGIN
ncbi:MAG: aldehyde ferredoxin oxidoreductase family protein, partial [Desulfurococcales archaeon]|nr:aldehyde ferredoxin oxidoreductase family protein [Desulfurococcales archaeon]